MDLKQYYGDKVKILADNGKIFVGKVNDYFYADETNTGNESIIIDTEDGRVIEFEEKDIQTIEVLEESEYKLP